MVAVPFWGPSKVSNYFGSTLELPYEVLYTLIPSKKEVLASEVGTIAILVTALQLLGCKSQRFLGSSQRKKSGASTGISGRKRVAAL